LLAEVNSIVQVPTQVIYLVEDKVVPGEYPDGRWVPDTGANNHMTGTCSALAHLNENVRGTVRFGNGSCVEICGIGSVVLEG
jgi:hypothetical protein